MRWTEWDAARLAGAAQYLLWGGVSIVVSYWTHGYWLRVVSCALELDAQVDTSASANFIFTMMAIVYAILVGCTFQICYDRQVSLVLELYSEVLIIERLLQSIFLSVSDTHLRKQLVTGIRRYIAEEIYNPHRRKMDSPFAFDSTFNELVQAISRAHEANCDATGMVDSARKLAAAQSRRSSVMALVLPNMHWLFMISMQFIFVICFLVFDATAGIEASTITSERRFNFASLVGTMVLVQLTLSDLNDPVGGLYSFRIKLRARLSYAESMLVELEEREAGWAPPQLLDMVKLNMMGGQED